MDAQIEASYIRRYRGAAMSGDRATKLGYREENDHVILTVSREDYSTLMMAVGYAKDLWVDDGVLRFLDRLNEGKSDYAPYQTGEIAMSGDRAEQPNICPLCNHAHLRQLGACTVSEGPGPGGLGQTCNCSGPQPVKHSPYDWRVLKGIPDTRSYSGTELDKLLKSYSEGDMR